jgi:hypothetical protein
MRHGNYCGPQSLDMQPVTQPLPRDQAEPWRSSLIVDLDY